MLLWSSVPILGTGGPALWGSVQGFVEEHVSVTLLLLWVPPLRSLPTQGQCSWTGLRLLNHSYSDLAPSHVPLLWLHFRSQLRSSVSVSSGCQNRIYCGLNIRSFSSIVLEARSARSRYRCGFLWELFLACDGRLLDVCSDRERSGLHSLL